MKGIVWYKDYEKGLKQFLKIQNNYEYLGWIEKIVNSKNNCYFIANNGDVWHLVKANENSKMRRANISYVDENIEDVIINNIINHCTTALPYRGFNYY